MSCPGEKRNYSAARCPRGTLRRRMIDPLDHVPDPDFTALDDARSDAAMAADGIIAAGPERLLHAAARRAFTGAFEQRGTDAKPSALQRQKVDSPDNKVSAQMLRRNLAQPQKRGRRRQILYRDQRDWRGPLRSVS